MCCEPLNMTDQQIVTALINRDEDVTRAFFYIKCYPLFNSIFEHYYTDCDTCIEFINEMYIYIMSPHRSSGKSKLESFRFESTLYTWIKVVCLYYCYARFDEKNRLVVDKNDEPTDRNTPIHESIQMDIDKINHEDVLKILSLMPNARYRELIRLRYLEGYTNEETAQQLGMTMDNYYNKHKLAKAQYLQAYEKEAHYGDSYSVKHFAPTLSEEKFAVWLDGMLPADEMRQIDIQIANDADLQSLLLASNEIAENMAADDYVTLSGLTNPMQPQDFDIQDFELPQIPVCDFNNPTTFAPDFLPDNTFDIQPQDAYDISGLQQDTSFPDMGNDNINDI